MSFAQILRKWRGVHWPIKARGRGPSGGAFTQAEAAGVLGVNLRTYQDWEGGRHEPVGALRFLLEQKIKDRSERKAGRPVASSNLKAKGAPTGIGTGKKRVTNAKGKTS